MTNRPDFSGSTPSEMSRLLEGAKRWDDEKSGWKLFGQVVATGAGAIAVLVCIASVIGRFVAT